MGDLSDHFSRRELECRCCGSLVLAPLFILKLEKLRRLYREPMSVNCGCRCPNHNEEVGGAKHSMHLTTMQHDNAMWVKGTCAVDIHCPMDPDTVDDGSTDRERLIAHARDQSWSIGHYETFLHLDCRHTIYDRMRTEWTG